MPKKSLHAKLLKGTSENRLSFTNPALGLNFPTRTTPKYSIRTPDRDESRGPFNIAKQETLAEAGQINPNTLYYNEPKEESLPLAINERFDESFNRIDLNLV